MDIEKGMDVQGGGFDFMLKIRLLPSRMILRKAIVLYEILPEISMR